MNAQDARRLAVDLITADLLDYRIAATGEPILEYQWALLQATVGGLEVAGLALVAVTEIAAMLVEDLARERHQDAMDVWRTVCERGPRPPLCDTETAGEVER
jgi:hypothetical protein